MSRRKKIMLGVLGSLAAVAIVGAVVVRYNLAINENQAVHMAQEYLEQKYLQDMQYLKIHHPVIDPAVYRVYFSPIDNPDLTITVMVMSDLTLRESNVVNNIQFMPDNYYLAYFAQQTAYYFSNKVKEVWGGDSNVFVSTPNSALYAFGVPKGLNDQMPLAEMEKLIEEYILHINTEQLLSEDNLLNEADRILTFIKFIRETEYQPDRLVFRYIAPKTNKDGSGLIILGISRWQEIETSSHIVELLNAEI